MVVVGGGNTGDCGQLVDGADRIRISWSGEHDDDHVHAVLMRISLGPNMWVFSGTPKSWGISNSTLMPNYCRTKDTTNFVY